jgi:hypothetical protein
MFDRDVARGHIDITKDASYSSTRPESSLGIKNMLPPCLEHECYLWDVAVTCTEEEQLALANETAVVKDYIISLYRDGAVASAGLDHRSIENAGNTIRP